MSAEAPTAAGGLEQGQCWCCGGRNSQDGLVHLGNHPEVGICADCARFLNRRARDLQATALRRRLRAAAESVRGQVMTRGWHQRPMIGSALRWVNQHLPW